MNQLGKIGLHLEPPLVLTTLNSSGAYGCDESTFHG